MKEKVNIDAVVIGGGLIGLATGIALLEKFPKFEVALLEKNPFLGDETSGRNSGILHAGLYYPPGSLKAKLCLEGLEMWMDFLPSSSIPWLKCGKYIVAKSEEELPTLENLKKNAENLGAKGLRWTEGGEFSNLSQYLNCKRVLLSEKTSVLDQAKAIQVLRNKFEALGGIILTHRRVQEIENLSNSLGWGIETTDEIIQTHLLLNCAGLGAVEIRKSLGLLELENYFVKGNYLRTNQQLKFIHRHIYPLPHKNLHGLGVHATIDPYGGVKFGPDTEEISFINYQMDPSRLELLSRGLSPLFKHIDPKMLFLDYCGIRPKIKLNGTLYPDFWLKGPKDHGLQGYIEACGIESPGLTSCFAIAKYLVRLIEC